MKNFFAPWIGLLAVSFTLWLGACSPAPQPPQPVVVEQQAAPIATAPVIVQAAPAESHDGFLTGMLMGHLLSGGGGGGGGYVHSAPTVVQHTTVVAKTVNVTKAAPAYRPAPRYSSPRPFMSRRR